VNLGYGGGANRGVAATDADIVVVLNPDLVVHPGAIAAMARTLQADAVVAVVGPRIVEADGTRYPSARRFPTAADAVGHALLARWWPANPFSQRYRMDDLDPDRATAVDWVSGACLAVRRQAWEELGGFDESYFMYAEDMDLCFRARRAGWSVVYEPSATVMHLQGVTTARRPYAMTMAHHRSALRFAYRANIGWRRLLVPGAALVLTSRLALELARLSLRRSGILPSSATSCPAQGERHTSAAGTG